MQRAPGAITELLKQVRDGRSDAQEELARLLQGELQRLARGFMRRERPDHTLQPTALVNEAYIRLADQRGKSWINRAHFLSVAAQVMRRILVDHARKHRAQKRGAGAAVLSLDEVFAYTGNQSETLLAVHQALSRLHTWDERQAQIVEWRFFGGLTEHEIAYLLDISERTVKREWTMAKAWLHGELKSISK